MARRSDRPLASAAVSCGVWRSRNGLVAVPVDDGGLAGAPWLLGNDDERWGLLERLEAEEGLSWALVIPDALARIDRLPHLALSRGIRVWLAPIALVEALRVVHQLGTAPPAKTAAAIARLLQVPLLRPHLRRLTPADRRQLRLL